MSCVLFFSSDLASSKTEILGDGYVGSVLFLREISHKKMRH